MVTTNGFPKSGTHALAKAVQLLGQPCEVAHTPFGQTVEGKHIFIKRDPRNIVCSWLRFNGIPVTPEAFIDSFRQFQSAPLVTELAAFEGWLSDADALVVEYQDLIASDAAMRVVAQHLNAPYLDGAFEALPGLTRTYYEHHSDYRTVWTPEVQAVWVAEGGPELLARWGY